ncbi:MAG: hydrogenase maturation nickel metallochaperone HypA [Candidatus Hydrothermarchaeaceae archaeon]
MHEFSVAAEMVKSILTELEGREVKRVLDVVLELGDLTSINPEQLEFCFDVASKGTILGEATLTINQEPAVMRCKCGYEGNPNKGYDDFSPLAYFICPDCDNGGLEILKGRELSIKNIKYEI